MDLVAIDFEKGSRREKLRDNVDVTCNANK